MGDLPVVQGIYEAFTKPNFEGERAMSLQSWLRLCHQTGLIDDLMTEEECIQQYWKAAPTGLHGLKLREFELALMYIARRKRTPANRVFDQVTLTCMKSIFKSKQEAKEALELGLQRSPGSSGPSSPTGSGAGGPSPPTTPWIIRTKRSLMRKKFTAMPPGADKEWLYVPDKPVLSWHDFSEVVNEEPLKFAAASDQVCNFLSNRATLDIVD
jgi:hypothetical protein